MKKTRNASPGPVGNRGAMVQSRRLVLTASASADPDAVREVAAAEQALNTPTQADPALYRRVLEGLRRLPLSAGRQHRSSPARQRGEFVLEASLIDAPSLPRRNRTVVR